MPGVGPARGRIELQPQAVERIGQGDLAVRMKAESVGENRVLEDGINAMADSLQALRDNLEARIAQATGQLAQRERANAAKSRFLAVASHDLRQPIHALGLFVARLRDLVGQGGVLIGCRRRIVHGATSGSTVKGTPPFPRRHEVPVLR